MSKLRNNKGITLVALIITIIVLLILAMVTIKLVMNGGIIDRAQRGTQAYSDAEIEEQIKLAYSEWQSAQYTGDAGDATVFMQGRLRTSLNDNGLTVTGSEGVFVVKLSNNEQYIYDTQAGGMLDEVPVSAYPTVTASTNNSAVTENSKYISNNKTAVIPAGYTISNLAAEQSIDNGLVISKEGNEWVWIPVSNDDLASMYTEDTTGWTMYDISGENAVVTRYKSIGNDRDNPGTGAWREPDILIGTDNNGNYTDTLEANWITAGYTSFKNMAESLRDDYKNMIDSIKKYGGFYVGRYELSEAGTQKNQTSLIYKNWFQLYAKCKTLGTDSVESRMIWGCQWDRICNFINTSGDQVSIEDSSTYGNYSNSQAPANTGNYKKEFGNAVIRNTGSNEAWKTHNIYDMAGNCVEWTQEARGQSYRSIRGAGVRC